MYVLACCDNNGKCFGFFGKDRSVISDENKLTEEYLMVFDKKRDTNEICMQINLGHLLLPNGSAYRVTPVKM